MLTVLYAKVELFHHIIIIYLFILGLSAVTRRAGREMCGMRSGTSRGTAAYLSRRAVISIYDRGWGETAKAPPHPLWISQSRSIAPSTPPNTSRSPHEQRSNLLLNMPSLQSTLTPPPMARTRTARNSLGTTYPLNPVRISSQPPPRMMMSPTGLLPEREGEQTVDGTLRLRGGCIPCPVRHFSHYHTPCRPRTRPCMLIDERASALRHYHHDFFWGDAR